jgi:protein-disulfide isomerase
MRVPRAVAAVTAAMLVSAVACTSHVTGTATVDPRKPPLGMSEDGYGIVAGYPDAPVQIELYTEPQCTHCADLQAAFGDDLKRHINIGDLAVTYRPLTFLDTSSTDNHSARVANALFLAVGAPEAADESNMASGPEFQSFVEDLWAHQDPGGPGPSDEQMARMAEDSGLPVDVANRIKNGETADQVDIEEMNAYNYGALIGIDPISTGTPTVYDLDTQKKVNIQDADWLDNHIPSA